MNRSFYKDIQGFNKFSDLTNPDHYTAVPADWYIVMTDIQGSTQAIAEGRYKDVNLVGAATIMAVINVAQDISIPYVFGGDGATLLIPAELLEKVQAALSAVRVKVRSTFGMTLRVGCISLKELYDHGASLGVAKFNLSQHMSEAMFQGTAITLAETWLRKGGGPVLFFEESSGQEDPDLTGLECRWQPIQSRNGSIISLLVQVPKDHAGQARSIYSDVIKSIEEIYPEYAKSCPTHVPGMHISFSPVTLGQDVKLRSRNNPVARIARFLKVVVINAIGQLSFKTGRKVGSFDGQQYLSEMVANSDTRKFDETLRMVIDSTPEQHQALERVLAERQQKGEITYGIHLSSQALMTCLVFSIQGNHIHFIDGADGGYAMASRSMKNAEKQKI